MTLLYHYNKEWYKLDLPALEACVKAAVYVGDGLVRHLGRFTERKLENIKNFFENLDAEENLDRYSNKRCRVSSDASQLVVSHNNPLQEFMQTCLVPSSGHKLHTHHVTTSYNAYLARRKRYSGMVESTCSVTKKLVAMGYIIPKKPSKVSSCCKKNMRYLLDWEIVE